MFTQIYVWRNVRARGNEVRKGGRGETEERAGPGKRGLRGSHPRAQIPGGEEEEGGARLFSAVSSDGTGDNGHSLKHRKFSLNTRKKGCFCLVLLCFLAVKVARQWPGFPREATVSPCGETLTAQLHASCVSRGDKVIPRGVPAHLGNPLVQPQSPNPVG